jgi:hypothetical protein
MFSPTIKLHVPTVCFTSIFVSIFHWFPEYFTQQGLCCYLAKSRELDW